MTHVAKVIELVGSSDNGWTEAAQAALDVAKRPSKTLQVAGKRYYCTR